MATTKVCLYIAMSLDGYIAGKDDDISWLDSYQTKEEDYGYSAFMKTVGTAIMGARTYLQSLEHPERLLKEVKTYVLSARQLPKVSGVNVEFFTGELEELIAKIKKDTDRDIYLVGGGQVISSFLNAKLLDEIRIFVVPLLLNDGIPLFSGLNKEVKLKLLEVKSFKSGIVELHYNQ